MIRDLVEAAVGKISDDEFKTVMQMTTDDIKFNRIKFKKMTYLQQVIEIAEHCYKVDQRIKNGCLLRQPTTISHYIRKEWDKSMKIGDFVVASEEGYGKYICRIEGISTGHDGYFDTTIMAVLEYPSQHAIIFKNHIATRKPYEYGRPKRFKKVEPYTGIIPEYKQSVAEALDKAIEDAQRRGDTPELGILLQHKADLKKIA